ncbi:phosphoglycerate kinase [Candidatus Collierbacteria bacterium]|nr:phosphoglycerate kinase [Candidatus Collierbacteria bacterium]
MIDGNLLKGKNVLLRADLDVPVEAGLPAGRQGRVANDFRLLALLPTLKLCLENAKSTLIIGHLGRPSLAAGGTEAKSIQFSLRPIQEWLEKALHQSIFFIDSGFSPGEWDRGEFPLAMFDNLRFHPGELLGDREFAEQLSGGSDIYVYEAFAAYNSAASLRIIPEIIPTYTGIQFDREVEELSEIVKRPARPSLLILSGAKDDKRQHVDKFVDIFDDILIGGKFATGLTPDGLDINEETIALFSEKIMSAKSVVINGPLGKFEDGLHTAGTKAIFQAAISSPARRSLGVGGPARIIIGGGDTLAAIPALGFSYSDFDFVSTGGGAMLEFLATSTHPLLEVIKNQSYARP